MNNQLFLNKLKKIKQQEVKCNFFIKNDKQLNCSIGWYGGNPTINNCYICLASERNNQESKKQFDQTSIKFHPPSIPKVSGCCDSAKNYH